MVVPPFLRNVLQKGIWPPGGYGLSLRLSGLTLGVGGVLLAAVVAWAFFMGFWVGRGQNPEQKLEQMRSGLATGSEAVAEGTEKTDQAQAVELSAAREQESGLAVNSSQQGTAAVPAVPPSIQAQNSGQQAGTQPVQATARADARTGAEQKPDNRVRKPVAASPAPSGQAQKPQAAGKDESQKRAESQTARAKQANAKKDKAQPVAKLEPARQGKPVYDYVYQVAASKSEADAKRLAQKLVGAGHKASIQRSGKVWLVVFSLRGTEDDAARAKNSAQSTLGKDIRGKMLRLAKNEVGKKPEQPASKGRK